MPQSTMPQIKNVVMLMLENRSVDNLFGYLYRGATAPLRFYPEGSSRQFDAFPAGASLSAYDRGYGITTYPIAPISSQNIEYPSMIPWYDPTEEYVSSVSWHGVVNQMFGDEYIISSYPSPGTVPRMLGFLQDYWTYTTDYYYGQDICLMYEPSQLPNLSQAAYSGAISDAWFSSVPTQTNPNRAYSIVGTSQGRDANLHLNAVEQYDLPTIFNGLASAGKECGLYFTDVWHSGQCFTQYTFPQLTNGCYEIEKLDRFYARAKSGALLPFTYLEPKWGYGTSGSVAVQGTDLHPPTSVTPGDQFVGSVIHALASNPKQWANTLLIITFDEHGGTYDHVRPAWGAKSPDGITSPNGFKFDLFGVRVPTILISPYIRPRTVFRAPAGSLFPFDHTSIIKTLLGWAGADIGRAGFFARMPLAPTFEGVLHSDDGAAADNAAAISEAFAEGPRPAPAELEPPPSLNDRFEGVARGSVHHIIATSDTPGQILQKIEDYKRDPEGFEAAVASGSAVSGRGDREQ